jgi:hypothetical protein
MLPFKLKTDFRTLSLLAFPTDILKTQVFERLSLTGRPLSLTAILVQTANSLNANLQSRNDLIQAIKAAGMIPPDELARIYFGLSTRDGHTDQSYPDLLNGTYGHTDDVIFFSHLLCQDLIAHGERLRSQWSKRYLRNRPILNKYDFKQAIDEGLMPDDKNYEDWLNIPSR